jgi:hypothetical protein
VSGVQEVAAAARDVVVLLVNAQHFVLRLMLG